MADSIQPGMQTIMTIITMLIACPLANPAFMCRCPSTGFLQRLHVRLDTMYSLYDVFTLDAKLRSNVSLAARQQYEATRRRYSGKVGQSSSFELPPLPPMARWAGEDLEVAVDGWEGACRLAPAVVLVEVEGVDELDLAVQQLPYEQREAARQKLAQLRGKAGGAAAVAAVPPSAETENPGGSAGGRPADQAPQAWGQEQIAPMKTASAATIASEDAGAEQPLRQQGGKASPTARGRQASPSLSAAAAATTASAAAARLLIGSRGSGEPSYTATGQAMGDGSKGRDGLDDGGAARTLPQPLSRMSGRQQAGPVQSQHHHDAQAPRGGSLGSSQHSQAAPQRQAAGAAVAIAPQAAPTSAAASDAPPPAAESPKSLLLGPQHASGGRSVLGGAHAPGQHTTPGVMLLSPFFGMTTPHFVSLLLHHMRWHAPYGVQRYLLYVQCRRQLAELQDSAAVQRLVLRGALQLVMWDELEARPSQPYLHQVSAGCVRTSGHGHSTHSAVKGCGVALLWV